MSTIARLLRGLFALVAGIAISAAAPTTALNAATFTYDASAIVRVHVHEVRDAEVSPAQLKGAAEASDSPSVGAPGTSTTPHARSVATEEGVLFEGAGSGTRGINFRPDAADPNWGLTEAHLDKHLFGSGPGSLSQIDAVVNGQVEAGASGQG